MATRAVFDAMRGAVDRAFQEGVEPLRWEVNEAAAWALANDARLSFQSPEDIRAKPLLGIPMTLFLDPSTAPKWYLIVEVEGRGLKRFGEWPPGE